MSNAEYTNKCQSQIVQWDLTWGAHGATSAELGPGAAPFTEKVPPNGDQAGFILANFTGRVVVLITGTEGYTPNIVASDDGPGDIGIVADGTQVQWVNYSTQTVSWVIVAGSLAVQGEMPPSSPAVTQSLATDVTAVGFQFTDFTGSISSLYGSTTLTAELQVQDEDNVKTLRAIRKPHYPKK